MRILFALLFLLLLTPVAALSQEHTSRPPRTEPPPPRVEPSAPRTQPVPGSWIRYESSAGRFSVLLPGQPKLSTQESATADGVKFTQYLSNASSATAVCLTGYFDQVAGTVFNFDTARDGMVNAIKGSLLWEKAISLGVHTGREFQVAANLDGTDAIFRVRIYQAHTRIYVLQFISEKKYEGPEIVRDSKKYLDSFTPYTNQ